MNIELTLEIDGIQANPRVFAFPGMSLSSSRASMVKHEFTFRISKEEIIARMMGEYEEWVAESKRDDEICGGPQDQLAKTGYPKLEALLDDQSLVKLVFGGYLMQKLFDPLVWDRSCDIQYWFDDTIDCIIKGDSIEINGICYSHPQI